MIQVTWPALKQMLTGRVLNVHGTEDIDNYYLVAIDGQLHFHCILPKANQNADYLDFTTNFLPTWNPSLYQSDTDGAQIVRNKAAKKGWTFASLPFEFETARLSDTLWSQESDGTSRSFITLKAYNGSGTEVTTAGLAGVNYGTIVKTVIDFEPPYDYEVVGGDLRTLTDISADMRLWIIAVPDIPANLGGSKEMGGGINMRYLAPGNVWQVDGRVAKYAAYSATYHTNKLRLIVKYAAGVNEALQIIIQLYRA